MSPSEIEREPRFDVVVQRQTTSVASRALDRHYLESISTSDAAGVLRIYSLEGAALSLGRYHLSPSSGQPTSVQLHRRLSGGRVVPFGDGFVGVSLIVPQRGALLGQAPELLQPYQILNRYVRGLLEGFKIAGLPVIYPGLDTITVRRLPVASIAIEETPRGAVLFEAVIANTCDFSMLPHLLDAADPEGGLKADMIEPGAVTSLQQELGTALSVDEVGALVQRGYEKQFARSGRLVQAADAPAAVDPIESRRKHAVAASLAHHACERTQLGWFEVHVAVGPDRRIRDILFAGDFIANSSAMESLEAQLRGCAVEGEAVDAVVRGIFDAAPNFILGIGQPSTIAKVIRQALG